MLPKVVQRHATAEPAGDSHEPVGHSDDGAHSRPVVCSDDDIYVHAKANKLPAVATQPARVRPWPSARDARSHVHQLRQLKQQQPLDPGVQLATRIGSPHFSEAASSARTCISDTSSEWSTLDGAALTSSRQSTPAVEPCGEGADASAPPRPAKGGASSEQRPADALLPNAARRCRSAVESSSPLEPDGADDDEAAAPPPGAQTRTIEDLRRRLEALKAEEPMTLL